MRLGNLDINPSLLVFNIFILVLVLGYGLGCSNEANSSEEVPVEVQELLKKLNGWDKEELDVLEQPDKYSDRIASGETEGWVNVHKLKLKELGFTVKWNCNKICYELQNN